MKVYDISIGQHLPIVVFGLSLAMIVGCESNDSRSKQESTISRGSVEPSSTMMSVMDAPIASKTVNALIKDAEPSFLGEVLIDAVGNELSEAGFEAFRQAMGGLWVCGTATLDESSLSFKPDVVQQALHAGDCTVKISLKEISSIKVRPGIGTNIIDIVTDKGTLSIRCFGADHFADKIREQRRKQRGKQIDLKITEYRYERMA